MSLGRPIPFCFPRVHNLRAHMSIGLVPPGGSTSLGSLTDWTCSRVAPGATSRRSRRNGAGELGDGLLSRVDEVGINLGFEWIRADAEHAVFGLQNHLHIFGNVVGDERGHADAEIDEVTIAQFEGDAAGDAFAFLVVS